MTNERIESPEKPAQNAVIGDGNLQKSHQIKLPLDDCPAGVFLSDTSRGAPLWSP